LRKGKRNESDVVALKVWGGDEKRGKKRSRGGKRFGNSRIIRRKSRLVVKTEDL